MFQRKVAWSQEEQLELVCKLLFKNDTMPAYSDITLGNRSSKAIGHALQNLKKKYGPAKSDDTTGPPTSTPSIDAAKATTKKATSSMKRTAATPASDTPKKRNKTLQHDDAEDKDSEEEV